MYGWRRLVAGEGPVKRFLLKGPTGSPLSTLVWTLVVAAESWLAILLVRCLGRPDLSLSAFCVAGVLGIVTIVSGRLCTQWWFWVTMIPVLGAHVLFILRVPWPESKWVPAPVLIAFALADAFVIFYVLYLVGKLMGKEALVKESFRGSTGGER